MDDILAGRFADAEARFAESSDVANAAGHPPGATQSTAGALMVAAWRGREEEARRLAETWRHAAIAAGRGRYVTCVPVALTILELGLGRYDAALVPRATCSGNSASARAHSSRTCWRASRPAERG